MKEKQAKLPGPHGPIAMECNPARVVIAVAGHVVADSFRKRCTGMIETQNNAIHNSQTLDKKQQKGFLHQVQQRQSGKSHAEYASNADFCHAFA